MTPLTPRHSPQLLDYLKRLDSATIASLTENASEEVIEAMECFITRLLGAEDDETRRVRPREGNACCG